MVGLEGQAAEQPGSETVAPALRRYPMRWIAIFPLVGAALGLALQIVGGRHLAMPLALFSSLLSMWLAYFGPPKNPVGGEPLDERERLVRIHSREVAGQVTSWLAMCGCFLIAFGTYWGGWRPTEYADWMILGFTLSTIFGSVTVLHASWTTQPIEEDE